jgi:hypothetical protein
MRFLNGTCGFFTKNTNGRPKNKNLKPHKSKGGSSFNPNFMNTKLMPHAAAIITPRKM